MTLTLLVIAAALRADEGMWLYNQVPAQRLKEKYGFEPTQAWLDHLRLSSVRFNSGGSGSFVSSNGLVMTNHHVAADALQKLSDAEHDLLATGFYARTAADEKPCVDLELNVLMNIRDVTKEVNAAVKPEMSQAEAFAARRAVTNTIEKDEFDKTGLRSDVVTLFQGGAYHLYQFKKYTDVRLVFAPEQAIAFFGGDPDNFEYPRYDLDISFFRVYEHGQPAKIEHFLRWSDAGVSDNDLIFVSGHPGRTNRLNTVAHLEYMRDVIFPDRLDLIRRVEVLLDTYSERSLENARRAKDAVFGYKNSRKARLGGLAGLQDPAVMDRKRAEEKALRDAVNRDSKLREKYGTAWAEVIATLEVGRRIRTEFGLLENEQAFHTILFDIARTLVRMAEEDAKPNAERLDEYGTAGRESLELELYSTAPIYSDLEIATLADSLGLLMEKLGGDNPLVKQILDGQSPTARAAALVNGTKLADVAERKRIAAGGAQAIAESQDPMILLAKQVDPRSRELRKVFEQEIEEPQRQAYAKIAAARFAILGSSTYPDATFTLRLAFGAVRGYEQAGNQIPPWTTIGGAYEHAIAHGSVDPFELPKRWLDGRAQLNLDTPFNFVSTADIIGGNSGSPVVNKAGELVGIIFDGNLESLVLDFAYTDDVARAVSVDSRAIRESLRKLYDATPLADELGR
ncbi:MAG: S46 family peptidase [Planctomycetaceae bacterium]